MLTIGDSISGGHINSILFEDGNGNLAVDYAHLNYNSLTHQMGMNGVTSPAAILDIQATGATVPALILRQGNGSIANLLEFRDQSNVKKSWVDLAADFNMTRLYLSDSDLGLNFNDVINGAVAVVQTSSANADQFSLDIYSQAADNSGTALTEGVLLLAYTVDASAATGTVGIQSAVAGQPMINFYDPSFVKTLVIDDEARINPAQTTTVVLGSVSGTAEFSQSFAGATYSKIMIYCNALHGTASFTFPVSFAYTPVILTTSGLAAALVTSLSTTAITVTGAPSTGFLIIEGY